MLATGCGYSDINPDTECQNQTCNGDPVIASGGYRICKPTSSAPAGAACYYQTGDGVITQCNSCSDCSNASAAIKTWCSSLQ
jgi:hypothetical protein